MPEHEPGDLVHRVVAPDILHVDQRAILAAQHGAVDRTRRQIKAGRGVDDFGELIKVRGPDSCIRQLKVFQSLHHVAEHRALRAA